MDLEVQLDRNAVQRLVTLLDHTVGSKDSVNPILGYVKCSVNGNTITLTAMNQITAAEIGIACVNKNNSEWGFCVPFVILKAITGQLDSADMTWTYDPLGDSLRIRCGGYDGTISCLPMDQFVDLNIELSASPTTLPAEWLERLQLQVAFAAKDDAPFSPLGGVQIVIAGDKALAAAVDGYRLAELKQQLNGVVAPLDVIIPAGAFPLFGAAVRDEWFQGEVEMSVTANGNAIVLRGPSITIQSRIIEGKFPDYNRFWPEEPAWDMEVDVAMLTRAIKLTAVTVDNNMLAFTIADNGIVGTNLVVSSGLGGKGSGKVECVTKLVSDKQVDDSATVGLNWKYLAIALKASPQPVVRLEIRGKRFPAILKCGEWRVLLQPMVL